MILFPIRIFQKYKAVLAAKMYRNLFYQMVSHAYLADSVGLGFSDQSNF